MLDHAGLRHTPAGIASLRLKVAHGGPQEEARRLRPVALETEVVAFGEVAEALARVDKGAVLKLAGFLDRKGTQGSQLELHVTEFGILKSQESAARLPSPEESKETRDGPSLHIEE